jgi:hypothetical protein
MSANAPARTKGLAEEILLAQYKENCDQARQHENLRERTTAMIAATVGVLLGFLGLKASGSLLTDPLVPIIASFIILLGAFGMFSSWLFDNRARMHRATIDNILALLNAQPVRPPGIKKARLGWIWYAFHLLIVLLGTSAAAFLLARGAQAMVNTNDR